eukprot:m.38207 g.38207  ORF g.38207 m.38207 type:complete len:154 (+) comp32538_c0_seq1:1087-1548(+)
MSYCCRKTRQCRNQGLNCCRSNRKRWRSRISGCRLLFRRPSRYQKSQRETAVLRTVKEELGKLDNILSSDVSILRDEIDRACRAYNVAKKRYDVAEAEFVAAKIGLHKASDLKEQMMEHLCMIIQQSELRKASRLEELTKQLESGGEVVDGLS